MFLPKCLITKNLVMLIFLIFLNVKLGGTRHGKRQLHHAVLNERPIIGVLTQSTQRFFPLDEMGNNYIPASYVKFVESSGARVVPIFNNFTKTELRRLFESINGAVFPGGKVNLFTSKYARTAKYIFEFAREAYDRGEYFPIIGMCLGHQLLATIINGARVDPRIPTNTTNITAPLNLPKNYYDTKIFRHLPKYLAKDANMTEVAGHFHEYSLPADYFHASVVLNEFYRIVTSNIIDGHEIVSTLEGRKYPFYGFQWHPEKPPFEWNSHKTIPHSSTAIKMSHYVSDFFVNEAKRSTHKFPSEEEERRALISNFNPVFTIGLDPNATFSQVYFFD
ncbi:gamma-glutamyl hydrolase-like [Xenia sp. Carnegie-2017]|uniref:gamma-glutamyl hydrolase-like n=1 Tax=Xenia sp. Carnegie-2017 TaxID=2897299 RepID=UPI001F03C740|nr:gamma-glutamyl hydrolase-like [Xenia sp. Carnegie-2017]